MIISVVSQKGGVGKSSLARTLAVEFTRAGWRVLLADTDYGQATSNRWNLKEMCRSLWLWKNGCIVNHLDLTILDLIKSHTL
nr:ParA family protein [Yersinia pestis]